MPLWAILSIASLFFIFVNGRMVPVQAMVSNVVSPQQRGGFMSINSSVQQLATGLAANLAGLIVHKTSDGRLENYDLVGYLSIALILTSIWLASRVKPLESSTPSA
jgi:predicted MFS family arabinose efflux permease